MPTTYEKIQAITLGSASGSIDFTSIPSTYTDLKVVITGKSSANGVNLITTFNGDSGSTNYSNVRIGGNGTTGSSDTLTNMGWFNILQSGFHTTNTHLFMIDIMSYTNSRFKSCFFYGAEDNNGSGTVLTQVGLWRNTSAISSINFSTNTGTMSVGSIFTLYGIKAA